MRICDCEIQNQDENVVNPQGLITAATLPISLLLIAIVQS